MEKKFDEIMSRLQTIVTQLQDNKLPVEEAILLFEEGIALIKDGEERLSFFDAKIKDLVNDEDKQ